MAEIIDVAVACPVMGSFHYLVDPEKTGVPPLGSILEVPFGYRSLHGFVVGFPDRSDIEPGKLKPINQVLVDQPLFDASMLKFLKWVSDYYCLPLGEVIDTAIPKACWKSLTTKRRQSKAKEQSSSPLGGLILQPRWAERPSLTQEQQQAVATILDPQERRPFLLHGVTGSGKTEVYMEVLENILSQGKGAIILVPEIALTPQLVGRFSARFEGKVAVLHSDLKPRDRSLQWDRLRKGEARIVIGARSAVFAPVKDLGLVVVDEEHEGSFKQEESPRYHARDIAIVRARFCNAITVLGSATPSLESIANAESGKYVLVSLKNRVHSRPLPKTYFVDLKDKAQWQSPEYPWLSRFLVQKIERTLRQKQQVMLYLNRLGFAHFLFCDECGHSWRCRNCDVSLTYYQHPPRLKCHYCGVDKKAPENCEHCSGTKLRAVGVGTEQVERELKLLFPQTRIARMDRSAIKKRGDLENLLNQIAQGEMDIVIGTQMIAKGHDFPGIALVGILLADASLNLPDFRANERTFQIITQVAGRAGRAEIAGEVVIQTVNPENPVLKAAAENKGFEFFREELRARRNFGFPPFQRLAMLRFSHKRREKVEMCAQQTSAWLKHWLNRHNLQCQLIGPSEAPLSKLKSYYRWQCLIKAESVREMQSAVRAVFQFHHHRKSNVQLVVDIDPVNSL